MSNAKTVMYLHALTGMHPGTGTALGTVDLPVSREKYSRWPNIPGSSLKGVLRDAFRNTVEKSLKDADESAEVVAIFGPPPKSSELHSGALSVTDARILAFPVRSLKGVFAWVTCPAALQRYKRDMGLCDVDPEWKIPTVEEGNALVDGDSPLIVAEKHLVLEEFEFSIRKAEPEIAGWIAENAIDDEATADRFKTHLVILNDDAFDHFVRYGTEVVARIGLDYERKTVREGALFYQEFLPSETLFYSLVLAADSRSENELSANDIIGKLWKLPGIIQVGGDETIGKGICAVKFSRNGGGEEF